MDSLAEALLELALASGAQVAEVYASSELLRPVIFEGNRLKQIETTQAEGMALRLWRDGKPGLAVGYGPVDPALLVEKALAISALNAAEDPDLTVDVQAEDKPMCQSASVKEMVALGQGAIAQLRDAFPEVVCEAELSCDVERTRLINSLGLDCRSEETTLSSFINAELVHQDDFLCVGDGDSSRSNLDMNRVTARILQRMKWAEHTVEPATGQVPVIFTAAASWLLWDTLRAALNGKRVEEGTSPWSDRLGQPVIDKAIHLRQDPAVGPYSCRFDDEGVKTQALTFVDKGVLKGWYCDRATGKKLQQAQKHPQASTGNGIRPGLGSYPTPGTINLLVTPGSADWDTLIGQQKDAIIVDQVMGEGGDITGDMSVNLELGYRVRNGEIIGRVKDTMVAGNAYTALNHLIALGSDADWQGSTHTPSVVVGSLSVAG
ncbi:MAG: TldD/PmbA family protein [Cyanobacteria bacterium P01_D01_bin.105]